MIPIHNTRLSLLQTQKESFQALLNPETQIPWKILNYDTYCQNILSTLYRVGDLRDMCITLHFNINQDREKLHGVTAIYFIQPIQQSIEKMIEDFQRDLYSKIVINFCSPLNQDLLEFMAKEIGKINGAPQKIFKIFSHNLDFISLNHNFFTFNHDSKAIVNNLMSIIITLKVQPLIIYQQNKKLEQVAKDLIECLKNTDINQDYPTLAIVLPDRDDDLNPLILHSNTYGALMHDIHNINNNKVTLEDQVIDLSPAYDSIWLETCNLQYPDARDKIDSELSEWNKQYQLITQQNMEISNALNSIDLVPQMNQQKKIIESHVNLASSILVAAKDRLLDKFYQLGQSIIQQENIQINLEYQQVKDQKLENLRQQDKLRLLILMLLNNYSSQQYLKCETQLNIKDEKYLKILQNVKSKIGFDEKKQTTTVQTKFKYIFNNIATKVQTHSKGLLRGMQGLLSSKEKRFAIVQLIENLFNNDFKSDELMSYFTIYDNKQKQIIVIIIINIIFRIQKLDYYLQLKIFQFVLWMERVIMSMLNYQIIQRILIKILSMEAVKSIGLRK